MCAALKVTRQGCYAWKSRPPSAHAMRDAELAELISQVRAEVRNIYGAPKAFMRLWALGVRTSRKRVARIMRERGWRGVTRACAKRPSGEKRASKRESADDLVKRRFEAGGPNAAWFADTLIICRLKPIIKPKLSCERLDFTQVLRTLLPSIIGVAGAIASS